MDKKQTPFFISHANDPNFVDILEEDDEGKEEEEQQQHNARPTILTSALADAVEKRSKKHNNNNNNNNRVRPPPPPPRSTGGFERQMSLETGLNRVSKGKGIERMALPRSGRSFGGFDSTIIEGKKGDFSMFRTKSTLSKQNSLLPLKKDHQMDQSCEGRDESENKSVPVGRYFAALRGPELDQVKVYNNHLFFIRFDHHFVFCFLFLNYTFLFCFFSNS